MTTHKRQNIPKVARQRRSILSNNGKGDYAGEEMLCKWCWGSGTWWCISCLDSWCRIGWMGWYCVRWRGLRENGAPVGGASRWWQFTSVGDTLGGWLRPCC